MASSEIVTTEYASVVVSKTELKLKMTLDSDYNLQSLPWGFPIRTEKIFNGPTEENF